MGGGRISSCARPGNFLDFLRTFRKFPGNSVIVPSLDRKRFPPWAYAKLPYRAWENCSGQCKGLFQAQKRKITMTSKENRNFCYSVLAIGTLILIFSMTLATPFGLFDFLFMAFDLKNAAQAFQSLQDNILIVPRRLYFPALQ